MVDLHDALRPTTTPPTLPISEVAARARRRKRRRVARASGMAVATLCLGALALVNIPRQAGTDIAADSGRTDSADDETGDGADDGAALVADGPGEPAPDMSITSGTVSDDPTAAVEPPASPPEDSADTLPDTGVPSPSTPPADTAPEPTATTVPAPATTPGIRTTVATTSDWEDGYCVRVEAVNETTEPVAWQIVLDLDGSIASLWSATAEPAANGSLVFIGEQDFNATLSPGAVTSFGMCMDT